MPEDRPQPSAQPAEKRLAALLADLDTLQRYLDERGRHSSELAQKFLANARRDPTSRAYDERQATMLEYQRYIWAEIAGRVGKLLSLYGDEEPGGPVS
ncbi:MAG TPA: hypothetical protein VFQ25_10705 [Ktedonobacterales bacterium]|nr:hypothetical protein [Ktedonobacterales bacterium]